MYDDLVKRLRAAAIMSEALSIFLPHSEGSAVAKLYNEAADAIEELSKRVDESIPKDDAEIIIAEVAKPRWIPVTERLPDAGKRVLCYCRANIYEVMKMWTDGDWVYDMNHVYMHSFVTHWMPLPEPPKEN